MISHRLAPSLCICTSIINLKVKFKLETYRSSIYHQLSGVRGEGGRIVSKTTFSSGRAVSLKVIWYPYIKQKTKGLGEKSRISPYLFGYNLHEYIPDNSTRWMCGTSLCF